MSTSYGSQGVRCPFYRYHSKRAIGCEGMTDTMTISLGFQHGADREQHMSIFCCSQRYDYCEIYDAVLRAKYPDDYEER